MYDFTYVFDNYRKWMFSLGVERLFKIAQKEIEKLKRLIKI